MTHPTNDSNGILDVIAGSPSCDVEELLTPRQAAALFHVHPKTVRRWATEGKIGSTSTPGGHLRYHRAEIYELLKTLSTIGPKRDSLGE